jgi:agmatinase
MATLAGMFGADAVESFLGLPRPDGAAGAGARIVVVSADCATPYASVGGYCAGAPAAIRAASATYAASLGHMNFDLGGPVFPPGVTAADAGDVTVSEDDPAGNRSRIGAAIGEILERGAVPVLVGGDDSVQIPMLAAYGTAGRNIAILQIDAHIDWRDEVQGEPLGLSSTMRRASEMAHVGQIVQVGARGIGSAREADRRAAEEAGVHLVTARDLARDGVGAALRAVPEGAEVVICLDLDALDPAIMPAVIGRTAGGLSYWDVVELVAGVAARARIAGVGFVEFMPERDIDGQGALTAAQLLTAILGIVARQQVPDGA